jgi:hypothetical protein
MLEKPARGNAKRLSLQGWPFSQRRQSGAMSNPSDFTVRVCNDRDIVISTPDDGFEVTYRKETYCPMLIADEVLRPDFDESNVRLLAQAWKVALSKAKSLGWLDEQKRKRPRR